MKALLRDMSDDSAQVEIKARLAAWESENLRNDIILLRNQLRCLRRNLRNLGLK